MKITTAFLTLFLLFNLPFTNAREINLEGKWKGVIHKDDPAIN